MFENSWNNLEYFAICIFAKSCRVIKFFFITWSPTGISNIKRYCIGILLIYNIIYYLYIPCVYLLSLYFTRFLFRFLLLSLRVRCLCIFPLLFFATTTAFPTLPLRRSSFPLWFLVRVHPVTFTCITLLFARYSPTRVCMCTTII